MNIFRISKNKFQVRYVNTYKNSFTEYWLRNFYIEEEKK